VRKLIYVLVCLIPDPHDCLKVIFVFIIFDNVGM
jgi:hypothetical protein